MSEEGFFTKYVSNPVKKFHHKCILRGIDWPDDMQNKASDSCNAVQENPEFLAARVQSNENYIV